MMEGLDASFDAVIFVGGIHAQLEGEDMRVDYDGFEGGDRTQIELPAVQQELQMVRLLTQEQIPRLTETLITDRPETGAMKSIARAPRELPAMTPSMTSNMNTQR